MRFRSLSCTKQAGIRMKTEKNMRMLRISLFGAVLTLIGDLLIGCARFPDGAGMIDGYLAAALTYPAWRPIAGGLIGLLGICLEVPGLSTVYDLMKDTMPKGAGFYRFSMYVYLALGGAAVHLPCGVLMWLYKEVSGMAGTAAAYDLVYKYILYAMGIPTLFFIFFFIGANIVMFLAFACGKTPFPKWYCLFNPILMKVLFNCFRFIGNYAIINGIGTSNMSLGAMILFIALLAGYRKYNHLPKEI